MHGYRQWDVYGDDLAAELELRGNLCSKFQLRGDLSRNLICALLVVQPNKSIQWSALSRQLKLDVLLDRCSHVLIRN